MVFKERGKIPKSVRPSWMNDSVVDPAWRKAHGDVIPRESPSPFDMLRGLENTQLNLLFDTALFRYENDKALSDGAREVREALSEFLEHVLVHAPGVDQRKLETALSAEVAVLMSKIRETVMGALDGVESEDLCHIDFIRGIYEHYLIWSEHDFTADELLGLALDECDDHDLERNGLMRIPAPARKDMVSP